MARVSRPTAAPAKAAPVKAAPAKVAAPAKPVAQQAKPAAPTAAAKAVAAPAAPSTALAVPQQQQTGMASRKAPPAFIPGGGAEAMKGKENISREDLGTPRVKLLQPLSPSVVDQARGPENGYKPGVFFFEMGNVLLGDQFDFVALLFEKEYIKWLPRDQGGGIAWRMKPNEVAKYPDRKKDLAWGENKTPPAATLHMNFVVIPYDAANDKLDPHGTGPFVMSFQKTSTKGGQQLCQLSAAHDKPMYAAVYTVWSKQVSNQKGTFFVPDVVPESSDDEGAGWVRSAGTLAKLAAMFEAFAKAGLKVDYSDGLEEDEADEGGSGEAAAATVAGAEGEAF